MENKTNKLTEGRDYVQYIEKLGPDAVKKMTQYHNTESSFKLVQDNREVENKLKVVEDKVNKLLNKGRQKWSDTEFKEFLTLTQTQVKLKTELETDLKLAKQGINPLIKNMEFTVKDINGKLLTINMIPTYINSKETKYNNHTLYKFKLPENLYIYMRKSTSLDFLKTVELV